MEIPKKVFSMKMAKGNFLLAQGKSGKRKAKGKNGKRKYLLERKYQKSSFFSMKMEEGNVSVSQSDILLCSFFSFINNLTFNNSGNTNCV